MNLQQQEALQEIPQIKLEKILLKCMAPKDRSVTQKMTILVRALSMPGIYGAVGKIYVEPEKIENLKPSLQDLLF